MGHIYDLPLSYRLCKKYVVGTFKKFYGEYIVHGIENLPEKGPVIFAPNHVNALMDALAVLSVTPDDYSTVFLARADLFKKPLLVKILTFIKIMPAFRIRDGYGNLGKNSEVFDKCVELLEKGNALCLMPEGNQELEKKIRPLVKGIFRIAFQVQDKIGNSIPVKIVPVGIDIEHLTKFGKNIIINIGEPIDVSQYMEAYNDNQAQTINQLKEQLYSELCRLTLNLNTEKYYPQFVSLSSIGETTELIKNGMEDETYNRFFARQTVAQKLIEIEHKTPEKMDQLVLFSDKLEKKFKKYNLRVSNFENNPDNIFFLVLKTIVLLVGFPLFCLGFLLNLLPFFVPVWIRKSMKMEFEGFHSSVQYVLGAIITFPLFYILQTIGFRYITGAEWWLVLLFLPFQYFIGKYAFGWYKLYKSTVADFKIRYLQHKGKLRKIKKLLKQINQIIQAA